MPRRRTSATTTFGTSETPIKKPDNGYFTKGQWHCNCQPRLPAVQFQVRRESKNKGRWFYTCQIDRTKGKTGEPRKCDFFLWAEDARLREEGAVLNNSTTEPGDGEEVGDNGQNTKKSLRTPRKLVQTTLSARVEPREEGKRHWTHRTEITPIEELERTVGGSQSDTRSGGGETAKSSSTMRATDSTSSSKTAANTQRLGRDDGEDELAQNGGTASTVAAAQAHQTPSAGTKRKRDVIELSDNDDGDTDDLFGDMDSDEERQLAAIAESSSHPGRKRDAFATPATHRSLDGLTSLPTPSLTGKSVRRVLFAEPEVGESSDASDASKRQRNDNVGAYTPIGADPKTPSSSQEGASPSSSQRATPGTGSGVGDITQEIMDLLKGQKIDELTSRKVRSALQRYAAKARGLEKGRDASRQALRNQEVKIAKLQERITNLENARMVDANAKKEMKIKLMEMYTHT